MQNTCNQLSFVDINHNLQFFFEDPDAEIISKFIPLSFYSSYNSHFGRKRTYKLHSYLYAFIFKSLLSISSMKLFIRILSFYKELRNFCGFENSIPDEAQFSRFKINFHNEINLVFHNLVEYTEILFDELNLFLASILISGTTGIEAYVTENNPKFYETELRKAKAFSKQCDDSFDYHKFAQSEMPKIAASNKDIY
ncbi:MAG: transposase [Bacillota bacterium]|nr:transposase [Bacillota bacterium]